MAQTLQETPLASHRVLVWELPVRLFHWTIFLLVACAYLTWRLNWMDWHVWIGYAALTAVLFRILWGFFGGDCARFARFLTGPRAAAAHLRHALRREPDRQVGHNAAGGWMVMLLLALLLAETLSGLLIYNDIADEGPLTELMPAQLGSAIMATHAIGWDLLAGAVSVHVAAILLYATAKRQNLVRPMITGHKTLPAEVTAPRRGGALRAIVLLAISAIAVAALSRYL
ncbi:MAG TPA: cytochrome b/b6 domain-containing protein [Steroidobacteraceae bacterium]|nr:cytochrome b/b6 domain-containing protein [Steroidobacteraceae bacterium]